jgi:hypothetical protein
MVVEELMRRFTTVRQSKNKHSEDPLSLTSLDWQNRPVVLPSLPMLA